ncbi:hypothetical protein SAMN04487898_10657 [Pedobacter sp. ok626]|nr:hypothetical protein SAMN04487898_10657 [Pedobacter sp. ok626]
MKILTNCVLLALLPIGTSIAIPYYNLAGYKVLECNEISDIQCSSFAVINAPLYYSATPAFDFTRPQPSFLELENSYYNQ